jgi:hypothetical protein
MPMQTRRVAKISPIGDEVIRSGYTFGMSAPRSGATKCIEGDRSAFYAGSRLCSPQ